MKKSISFFYEHAASDEVAIYGYDCECEIEYSVDYCFGEDADGNRCSTKVDIEEVSILSCVGIDNAPDLTENEVEELKNYACIKFYES